MRFIDLTHPLNAQTAVYPGDHPVMMNHVAIFEKDGFNNFEMTTGMHNGTHVDGLMHLSPKVQMIGDLPLDSFTGKGVVIDVRGEQRIDFRTSFQTIIPTDAIVLFYSGHDRLFGKPQYFKNFPTITESLARFLADRKVKMIGIDWPSPDHPPYPIHTILLENNILILENLTHLDKIPPDTTFELFAFPLKIDADSSIVRAVVRID